MLTMDTDHSNNCHTYIRWGIVLGHRAAQQLDETNTPKRLLKLRRAASRTSIMSSNTSNNSVGAEVEIGSRTKMVRGT